MPRLSLCMIARDEEAFLPGCLASVRSVVDEIVLVDTGSTDRTREVAREAGAVVLEQPWGDDFSAPRNLGLANATGDWVLVLDADERLAPGAGEGIRRAIADPASFDVGYVRLHDAARLDAAPLDVVQGRARIGAPAVLPRLLRRTDGLRFEGLVHENVGAWFLRRGSRSATVDADVVHLGAIPSVRDARRKRARNLALLRAQAQRDPEDVTPLGYLALELFEDGALDEAEAIAERGWALLDRQPPHRWAGRLAVARALVALRRGAPERVLETAARLEGRDGPSADLRFLRGCAKELLAARGPGRGHLLEEALADHRAALELVREWPTALAFVARPAAILVRIGSALLSLGRAAAALEAFRAARAERGDSRAAVLGEAEALLALGDAAGALAVVEPVLEGGPDGWVIASAAASALGAREDARTFLARAARCAPAAFELPHLPERARALAAALASTGG